MNEIKDAVDSASHTIEGLYDAVRTLLFVGASDVSVPYSELICHCGISPESRMSKDEYEKCKRAIGNANTNRYLYWYDMELKIQSLADRVFAVGSLYADFDAKLPRIDAIDEKRIQSARIDISRYSDDVYISANNVFVIIAAGLDILAKVAYEISHMGEYNFAKYNRMKSADVIFKQELPVNIEFKESGMAFSEMPCLRLIEAFRNEYVHNSSWSYRASVYEAVDTAGCPLPRFMLFPDYDERGCFIKSGARGRFYSQGNKINEKMPDIIVPAINAIDNTVKSMIAFCYKRYREYEACQS